jgi:hypothetical protein
MNAITAPQITSHWLFRFCYTRHVLIPGSASLSKWVFHCRESPVEGFVTIILIWTIRTLRKPITNKFLEGWAWTHKVSNLKLINRRKLFFNKENFPGMDSHAKLSKNLIVMGFLSVLMVQMSIIVTKPSTGDSLQWKTHLDRDVDPGIRKVIQKLPLCVCQEVCLLFSTNKTFMNQNYKWKTLQI